MIYDAIIDGRRITVVEDDDTRSLLMDDCEQGAMRLADDDPVFDYLWFHRLSRLAAQPVQRALVLGAGAFTLAKCLALDYPHAAIDCVDYVPALAQIGKECFGMDRTEFGNVLFHASTAEEFIDLRALGDKKYDFIFDDLFDGFQRVPKSTYRKGFLKGLCAQLSTGGVCVKNVIWSPLMTRTRVTCEEAWRAWRDVFPIAFSFGIGDTSRGHNRLYVGSDNQRVSLKALLGPTAQAGIPERIAIAEI